jgi:ribonucleotide reductase alpha subunit
MEADFFEMFWRGYVGGATPVLSNMGTSRGLPISCLETGTLVKTGEGDKEIQNLAIGDLVVTHNGNLKPVLNVWSRQTKSDLYELKTEFTTLNITGNHPVYTIDHGWVPVDQLDPSIHEIITCQADHSLFPIRDIDVFDYTSEYTVTPQNRETTVWDIEVDEDHSFIAQGVVVHNCYSTHISDSIHSIYSHLKEVAALSKHGGGVGVYLGDVRPSGSHITGGGKSTGVVPWARQYDYASQVVSQGGVRRGSFALYIPIDHPDLPELLRAKDHSQGDPRNFIDSQIAVTIEDKWLESMIEGDREKQKLFGEILKIRLVSGSPYLIFIDNANNQRPSSFAQRNLEIFTSNLCFTGDTLVAVADGRNSVPISKLEGTSFPVYSARPRLKSNGAPMKQWVTEIKNAVAFCTGAREVVEVELEDGSTFRCTPDHQLALRDTTWVEASNSVGKVLEPFTSKVNRYGHREICCETGFRKQGRMIWEHHNGPVPPAHHVDHIVSQGGDNIENLQLLTKEEHWAKTSQERTGSGNPIHGVDKDFHSAYVSAAVIGKSNPRFSGVDNYELIHLGKEVFEHLGYFNKEAYLSLREEGHNVPLSFSNYRFGGSFTKYTDYVTGKDEYKGEYDVDVAAPENKRTSKFDEQDQIVRDIRRNGLRVVSVRSLGVEKVYDLTVEDNHNFYIITNETEDLSSGVLVHNCSEIFLPTDENHTFVCVLSSLNLAKWDEWKDWRGSETGKSVPELMVYFLDAVIDEFITKADRLPSMGRAVRFARKSRALGIGTMGLHALYQKHNLPFASPLARELNIATHKYIDEMTLKASQDMAVEYGEPEWCKGDGIRHATRTAIAPTKSNSVICGAVSQGIEPIDSNYYVAKQAKGSFVRKNPYLAAHLEWIGRNTEDVWDSILDNRGSVQHLDFLDLRAKEVFKTAREIDQFEIVKQASDRQRYVCQGQSVNLFVDPESTPTYLMRLHLCAWKAKLKSLYYLKSSSLLVKKTVVTSDQKPKVKIFSKPGCPYCERAKLVLRDKGYSLTEAHPDQWSNGKFPFKTVPQIWIGDTHIGGYEDLIKTLTPGVEEKTYEECEACQG